MAHNGDFLEPITVAPGVPKKLDSVVQLLKKWNEDHSEPPSAPSLLDQAVHNAMKTGLAPMQTYHGIIDATGFLSYANRVLRWIPDENNESTKVYDTICLFHFILDQIPLGPPQDGQPQTEIEQLAIRPESVDKDLTYVSAYIVTFAKHVGIWMDTQAPLTQESFNSFKRAKKYNYSEWKYQDFSQYQTFNQLFYRELKDGIRPIDPEVVVYPADCTFDEAFRVEGNGEIIVKSLHWKIHDLLEGSEYCDYFADGVWMHAFLNTFNYHRQHSPVDGVVLEGR
jgi:hypothetical protein